MTLSVNEEKLKNRIRLLEFQVAALKKGARAVLKHDNFESTARSIFSLLKELIGATAGYVALLSEKGFENELLFLDSGNLVCTVNPYLPMPVRGLREKAYDTGRVVFENNFSDSQYTDLLPDGHVELTNVMFVPLVINKAVVGLIGLANKPDYFTRDDAQKAGIFGEFAAIALQNARLEEDRKKFERSLLESEARFQKLYKFMREGVCFYEIIHDAAGNPVDYKYMDMNRSFENAAGFKKKDAVGKPATEVHKSERPPYFDIFLKVAQTGKPTSMEIYSTFLGKYFHVSAFSPRENQFACIFVDTTYEKMGQEYLSTTLNAIGDGVIEIDRDSRIVQMNPMAETLTGWKGSEAIGQALNNVYHAAESCSRENWPPASGTEDDIAAETRPRYLISKTGKKYVIYERRVPIKKEDDTVAGVLIIFRDETEKFKVEMAIREQQAELDAVYQNAPLVLMLLDSDGNLQRINRAAEILSGRTEADILGMRGGDALNCPYAEDAGCGYGPFCEQCTMRRIMNETFETGIPHFMVPAELTVMVDGEDHMLRFLLSTSRIHIRKKDMVLASLLNITHLKTAALAGNQTAF